VGAVGVIRPAYSTWPLYNSRFRDVVSGMTEEQLAIQPAPDRWPLWASGAETTPLTNAGYDCPGDDDLEHVLSGEALAEALDSTFRIIQGFLDQVDDR
jgi:hypothetical protein